MPLFYLAPPKGAKMKRTIMAVFFSLLCAGTLSFATAAKPVSAVVSTYYGGVQDSVYLYGYYTDYHLKEIYGQPSFYEQTYSILPLNIQIQMDETVDSIRYDLNAIRHYYEDSSYTTSTSNWQQQTGAKTIKRPSDGKFSFVYEVRIDSAKFKTRQFYEVYDGIVALDSAVDMYAWVEYKLKGETKWRTSERYISNPLVLTLMRTVRVKTAGDGTGTVGIEYRYNGETHILQNMKDTVLYLHPEVNQMIIRPYPNDSSTFHYWIRQDGSYINTISPIVDFRGDTAIIAEFGALYYMVDFPQKEGETMGSVNVVNNTTGAMMAFTHTKIHSNSELTFSANPHDGYVFDCWARQKNDECVSTTNPLKFRLSRDTSLYAKFSRVPFQASLRLTYKMEGTKRVNFRDTSLSEVDLVYTRDSLGFMLPIKGGPTTGYIYCRLQASPKASFDAATLVSSRVFSGKVIDAYVKDSMTFSLGISKLGVFSGKNIKLDPYTYFRMQVYSSDASFDTLYTKTVRITWNNLISFINADGDEIKAEAKPSNAKVSVPTDRSLFALPRETDSTRYSYHWESGDGKRIEATTTSIYATDSAHYRIVADSITFRVRYLDYKGYAYKTDWLDSNTAISDAPKPNTLQDAAYWIRAIGGSRDLPLVLKGPVDIHAAYDYKVRFFDYDGNELSEGFVGYGKAATPPENEPTRDGYVFSGWDKEYDNVTDTMTVWATYEKVVEESSSSVKPASSSVQSSSSSAKSSSSVKSSSSSAKSSSSKVNSSSSKAKSSSSKGKDAIVAVEQVPQFSLTVVGRGVQIAGARVGSAYAVLDMQGRVLESGRVNNANFNLVMKRAATYLVRVGSQTQVVNIR